MLPITEFGWQISTYMACVSAYGFVLFLGCWIHKKSASSVYIYITFLLLGMAIDNGCEAYARYQWIQFGLDTFRKTAWWPMRLVIELVALSSLIGHMTLRAFVWRNNKEDV